MIYVLQDEAESFLFSNEQYHSPTLERTIPGTPGKDYPFYSTAPLTEFTCDDKEIGGKFFIEVYFLGATIPNSVT